MFSIPKSKVQSCVLDLKPGKEIFGNISKECAYPLVERECRYGGKNSRTIYPDCSGDLARQMGRNIKNESAAIRKLGGKRAKEATKLMDYVGDANALCRAIGEDNNSGDAVNVSFCRAIILTQTYGMLHYIRMKMKP